MRTGFDNQWESPKFDIEFADVLDINTAALASSE